jgi:hypothetical protein
MRMRKLAAWVSHWLKTWRGCDHMTATWACPEPTSQDAKPRVQPGVWRSEIWALYCFLKPESKLATGCVFFPFCPKINGSQNSQNLAIYFQGDLELMSVDKSNICVLYNVHVYTFSTLSEKDTQFLLRLFKISTMLNQYVLGSSDFLPLLDFDYTSNWKD